MIPTHGTVNSVFLLANAVRHVRQPDIPTWVSAARARSAFLAAAIDHEPVARFLVRVGLVSTGRRISPSSRLRAVSGTADRSTLVEIAALLLDIDPPAWLAVVVANGEVRHELIPSADADGLAWLQPELDKLLIDAAANYGESASGIAVGIGRAGELAIFAALTEAGACPIHVSEVSDRFGYDIESTADGVRRWEVKGCTQSTAGAFHLSRNEFDKSQTYGREWTLIQVEFASEALVAERVVAAHVLNIRQLSAGEILSLVPPDSQRFRWEDSAWLRPVAEAWELSNLRVPDSFDIPSFVALSREAARSR